jgi:hypothetical protein
MGEPFFDEKRLCPFPTAGNVFGAGGNAYCSAVNRPPASQRTMRDGTSDDLDKEFLTVHYGRRRLFGSCQWIVSLTRLHLRWCLVVEDLGDEVFHYHTEFPQFAVA